MATPRTRVATLPVALAALLLPGTGVAAAPAPADLLTLIVTYDAPPTPRELDVLAGVGHRVHGFTHVPAAVVTAAPGDLPLLRALPGVRRVFRNEVYRPLLSSTTRATGADRVWADLGVTGAGVGVAVIDAGVDGTHPDLCAAAAFCRGTPVKLVQNVKVLGREDQLDDPVVLLEDQVSTDSSSGHGSHVAGIAAGFGTASTTPGRYRGVAPGASVVGYGTGEAVEAVNVLAAYDHAIAHRDTYNIRVVNNSWGPGAFTDYDPEHPVNRATDAAWAAGISVVFGSGNDGTRTDSLNMFSAHPRAVSVAASAKNGHLAFFSSRGIPGSPLWRPTVVAPGDAVTSVRATTGVTLHAADAGGGTANPDAPTGEDTAWYATSSGTSMAAPHVSGVIALVQEAAHRARGVWLTPAEVRDLLQATARPMHPAYQAYQVGAGHVDAYAAVRAAAAGAWPAVPAPAPTDVRTFGGPLAVGGSLESAYDVLPGATGLDVMVEWGVEAVVPANQDVDITLYRPDGSAYASTFLRCDPNAQPNGYSSFCSSAASERLVVADPEPGRWRVVASGFFLGLAGENLRGLWAARYAPGAAPAGVPPAAVALSPASGSALAVAQTLRLTATVTAADGTPVPNAPVTWTSSGPGRVGHAESWTDSRGRASATVDSLAPGRQLVTATSGALAATATVDWLGVAVPCLLACPEPSTPGEAGVGGWWQEAGGKRHVGLTARYERGGNAPAGRLSYDDRAGTRVTADAVDRLRVTGTTATVTGPATVNGRAGYRYEVTVVDAGEPGHDDTVRILVTGAGYRHEAGGRLGGGNARVARYS